MLWFIEFPLWLFEAFNTRWTAEKAVQRMAQTSSLKLDIL